MDVLYTNNDQSTELQSYSYILCHKVLSYSFGVFNTPLVAITPIRELKSIPLGSYSNYRFYSVGTWNYYSTSRF